MNETLKEKLKNTTSEINKIFGKHNQIIWLQVLLPKTYLLKEIEAYTYTLLNKSTHNNFIDSFVYGENPDSENPKIKRSLHYLTFDEPYQYKPILHHIPISNFSSDYKLINDGVVITDGSSLKDEFSGKELFKGFWSKWCDEIKNFASNSSTLWSYIEIPDIASGEKKILSYYVVFKNSIECKNTQSKINKIFQNFLIGYGLETYSSELRKTALQSSLSAVMSRNQSHNIGSHVLNNLSNPEKIKEFLYKENEKPKKAKTENNSFKKGGYVSLYSENSKLKEKKRYHLTNPRSAAPEQDRDLISDYITKEDLYPENLIAHFNTYLKSRMDFIGDVGTSVQASLMNTSNLFDEVFAFFEKNLILLREISGKEDEFQYGFSLIYNGLKNKTGPQVAMPNGLLGQQAFYIILENIIRNTAKHESVLDGDSVCFTIEVNSNTKGIYKDFCEISIYSNISQESLKLKDLVENRNTSINESVLDKNNTVRKGGWGTIEMKLAAAYLCGINLLDIDDEAYHVFEKNKIRKKTFPILEAITKEVSYQEHFGYRFYMRKPKLALVVFEDKNVNSKIIKSINDQAGVCAMHKDDKLLKSGVFNHDFLILVGKNLKASKWTKEATNLPQRIIVLESLGIKENPNLEKYFWGCYSIQHLENRFDGELVIKPRFLKFRNNKYSFDKHGGCFNAYKNKSLYKYIEPFGSNSIFGQLFNDFDENNKNSFLYQCIEAIATKIIIVDERIQAAMAYEYVPENINGTSQNPIKFSEIYKNTGVIIPEIENISLIKSDLGTTERRDAIQQFIQNNIKKVQYMVLHYGIIEVLDKLCHKTFLTAMDELVQKENPNCKIVIVSGRGQTKDIPAEYNFINYSTFSYYLTNPFGRSKLHLTQLLKAARAKS